MAAIIFFRGEDGSAPFLNWFDRLPERARIQCRARLRLLAEQGHQLRRPAADYLRDGVYELRAKSGRVHYRVLYFFHGRVAIVISHGITKHEAVVPPIEIERALQRKRAFEIDPQRYSYEGTI